MLESNQVAKIMVEMTVGVESVARIAKASGLPYAGVNVCGNHRPGYLPLAAARTLLALVKDGASFTADLGAAINKAEKDFASLKSAK